MEQRAQREEAQVYVTNLDYTLKELQKKGQRARSRTGKREPSRLLPASLRSTRSDLPHTPIRSIQVAKEALEELTNSDPFLPFPGSLLPALLALRKTHQTIQESKAYLASKSSSHEHDKRQLEADKTRLKDQKLLTEALSTRIKSLREELNAKVDVTPADGARERLQELKNKKRSYDNETSQIMKSLLGFIDNQLAPMLAAEELGGPVVGDMMDMDPEDLAAGFNAQGKRNKAKDGANPGKRQRRIDEIWGGAEDHAMDDGETHDEVSAAGLEMRQLTEELLNQLAGANGDNSTSYVQLPRESAAARFLVRSKVAQFHPKDATRLRLVDFGRELEA
ncbi:hypothetical protein G7046_g5950 [Stylonectria norvegica]|nr:hypothetical protein G7046_g5950 [Stylonectria norvegica]